MAKWFLHEDDGGESGPYTSDDMRHLVDEGRITRESAIRREDMDQWVRASSLANLFAKASARLRAIAARAGGDQQQPSPRARRGMVKPSTGSVPAKPPPPEDPPAPTPAPEHHERQGVVKPRADGAPAAELEDADDALVEELIQELGIHENEAELEELRQELGLGDDAEVEELKRELGIG